MFANGNAPNEDAKAILREIAEGVLVLGMAAGVTPFWKSSRTAESRRQSWSQLSVKLTVVAISRYRSRSTKL